MGGHDRACRDAVAKKSDASLGHDSAPSQCNGRAEPQALADTCAQQLKIFKIILIRSGAQLVVHALLKASIFSQLIEHECQGRLGGLCSSEDLTCDFGAALVV